MTVVELAAAPFAVILILFLVALIRCREADIPKVMEALAAVLKACCPGRLIAAPPLR